MRAVIQRVSQAAVQAEGEEVGDIGPGLVVLLGIHGSDTARELAWMSDKIINLRIFPDREGKMNKSLADIDGEMLIVSQFTLYGDCRKGRRPGYSEAARPEQAAALYEQFVSEVNKKGIRTATGQFQAYMQVSLVNDGPVTLMLDSAKTF
jgi:D-tyrosyl-tRNA(Tyr) deacylase